MRMLSGLTRILAVSAKGMLAVYGMGAKRLLRLIEERAKAGRKSCEDKKPFKNKQKLAIYKRFYSRYDGMPMLQQLSPRRVSYLLFFALAVVAVVFHLTPALLAGIFSYTLIDSTHRGLARWMPVSYARWLALLIFVVAGGLMAWMFARFLHRSLTTIPAILSAAMPKLNEALPHYGIDLPFENMNELRRAIIDGLKENTSGITQVGGILTKRFFHLLVGIFVAVLCFMSESRRDYRANLYDAVAKEFNERVRLFMQSFERVLGAQVVISGINTFFTALFLWGLNFPHVTYLVPATFILGILPVVGNLLSNAIIVGTALTISPRDAVFALLFLVTIHKGEYFLNSKIVGGSIQAPMWQTLLGILIGDAIMGIPGIILAPALLHYVREEMREIPAS